MSGFVVSLNMECVCVEQNQLTVLPELFHAADIVLSQLNQREIVEHINSIFFPFKEAELFVDFDAGESQWSVHFFNGFQHGSMIVRLYQTPTNHIAIEFHKIDGVLGVFFPWIQQICLLGDESFEFKCAHSSCHNHSLIQLKSKVADGWEMFFSKEICILSDSLKHLMAETIIHGKWTDKTDAIKLLCRVYQNMDPLMNTLAIEDLECLQALMDVVTEDEDSCEMTRWHLLYTFYALASMSFNPLFVDNMLLNDIFISKLQKYDGNMENTMLSYFAESHLNALASNLQD